MTAGWDNHVQRAWQHSTWVILNQVLILEFAMAKSKGWCFTINNPTNNDEDLIQALSSTTQYLVIGNEHGQEGTFHLQGFLRLAHPTTMRRIQQFLPRAHLEIQRGTAQQAAEYCKKDGDFREWGELPRSPGQQSKDMWRKVIQYSESGQIDKIRDEFPHVYFLHFKRIQQLRLTRMGVMSGNLQHEWWVGPTGTGKSRHLWEMYPDHYQKSLNKWWDDYNNEEVVAIEEIDPDSGKWLGSFIKIWADRYPFSPEVKGGHLQKIRPKKIIILSNYTIDQCFERENDRDPIKRRFKVINFPTSIFPQFVPRSPIQDDELINTLLNLSQ